MGDRNDLPRTGMVDSSTIRMEELRLQQAVANSYSKLVKGTQKITAEAVQQRIRERRATKPLTEINATTFVVLPRGVTRSMPHWLIEIQFFDKGMRPIGIEVADDLILGLTKSGNKQPDLDLSIYGADEHGVSRMHVMLKPSYEALALLDLNSTNGTWLEGQRIRPHTLVYLQRSNFMSLGALSFVLRIISTPFDLGMNPDDLMRR